MRWTKQDEAAAKIGGFIIKVIFIVIILLVGFGGHK